jgi:hypothetical protein
MMLKFVNSDWLEATRRWSTSTKIDVKINTIDGPIRTPHKMPITILKPAAAIIANHQTHTEHDAGQDLDSDSDVDMDSIRPSKRAKNLRHLVTPGEIVTEDPQWMRCVLEF